MADDEASRDEGAGLLRSAQASLASVLLDDPNNRGLGKCWLVATLGSLPDVPDRLRQAVFNPCGGGAGPLASCRPAALALLGLLVDARPADASRLLAADPAFLRGCLAADAATARAFFGGFSASGMQAFGPGARALANYALTNRGEVWELLAWAGKHPQAPVAVAAKPQYFAELDVAATVRALARRSPAFWSSHELARSCEDGGWLRLRPGMAAEELLGLASSPSSSRRGRARELVSQFVSGADWALLCNRLLPLLPDGQLLAAARLLGGGGGGDGDEEGRGGSRPRQEAPWGLRQWLRAQGAREASAAAQAPAAQAAPAGQLPCVAQLASLLLAGVQSWDLRQVVLANALTCHRAQLLRLLREDEAGQSALLEAAAASRALWGGEPGQAPPRGSRLARRLASHLRRQPDLQLLLLGWLLRLWLLLESTGGGDAARGAVQQLGAALSSLRQQRNAHEEEGRLDSAHAAAAAAGVAAPPDQGPAALRPHHSRAARPSQGVKLRRGRHKRKHRCKPRRGQGGGTRLGKRPRSSGAGEGSSAESSISRDSGRRHRRRKRRRRHSSSSSSSSSSGGGGGWEELDLDGGGELLDPTDFEPHRPAPLPAAVAPAGIGGASGDGQPPARGGGGAGHGDLAGALASLPGFLASGQRQQSPCWVVRLPAAAQRGGATQSEAPGAEGAPLPGCSSSPVGVAASGGLVEVLDAAAWQAVWRWLAPLGNT